MKTTTALPAVALLALLGPPTLAQTPLPQMDLHWQSLDGNPSDVVGPVEVPSPVPLNERVWGLQGRRREAWQVSTRERQLDEEDKDFDTRLTWGAIDLVVLQTADERLFTLTERHVQTTETGDVTFPARIKVDRIQNPAAPETLQEFIFPDADNPRSIITIPEENKLIVVMATELRIYDYDNPPLFTLDSTPMGVAPMPNEETDLTSCNNKFNELLSAQVEMIQVPGGEERMALVAATIATTSCSPPKPQVTGILVANLQDLGNPFFYDNVATQAWDPCRTGGPCEDWRVGGFDHVRTISMFPKDLVYAVGGAQIGLTKLDFTGWTTQESASSRTRPTRSIHSTTSSRLWPIPQRRRARTFCTSSDDTMRTSSTG